jgi:DNA-binding transcriptional MerR regulator
MAAPRKHKHSQAELSKMSGVSVKTLRTWAKDEGLDLGNIPAVMTRAGKVERDVAPDGSETYSDARRRKMIAEANRTELTAQREAGELVSLAAIEDAMAELGHELKSRLIALPQELAVVLAGLGEVKIHEILKSRIHEILKEIHENSPLEKP